MEFQSSDLLDDNEVPEINNIAKIANKSTIELLRTT